MKIVMLCDFFNEKLEYQENLLVKYYTKHNHNVTVIASTFESVFDYYNDKHNNQEPAKDYYYNGIRVIKLKYAYNILNRIRKYTSISKILEAEKPDLIYIHDIMPNMIEAVKYKKMYPNCKMIMDYHADYSNSAKNKLSLNILHKIIRKRIFFDRAKKHFSKIFPIVPASAVFLNEVYGVPYENMELLPLGADTDLGKEIRLNEEGIKIRKKLNIPTEHFVIFTGGKLNALKKTEILIEAFNCLNDSKMHLIVVGDSGDKEEDIAYKNMLLVLSENSPNIHFVGWLSNIDVYKYLNASNMAAFPANQSILWQQAISMGIPLLVGDIGSQSISYLNKYGNIIIWEKEHITSDNFKSSIEKIKNNKDVYTSMKEGAFKITEEMLNWDTLILKTLRFNTKKQ
jgi:1,2-diacylglycerol 3-alpha-glucosyltransferase